MISEEYIKRVESLTRNTVGLTMAWDDFAHAYNSGMRAHVHLYVLACTALTQAETHGATFEGVRRSMADLHMRKNAGYAGDNPDPWANFRECTRFGISTVQGAITRMSDKIARYRVISADPSKELVNESAVDTLTDLAAYAIIITCLMDEPTTPAVKRMQLFYDVYGE